MVLPAIDWKSLTDEEVSTIIDLGATERSRREKVASIPEMMNSLSTELLVAKGKASGEDWVAPTEATTAYPKGWKAKHGGKVWESTTPFNVWEPGVSGWREVVPEETVAAWVQPTGAHDAYAQGDKVSYKDQVWTSNIPNNVWEPGVHGWSSSGSAARPAQQKVR